MSRRPMTARRWSRCCPSVVEALERRTLRTGVNFNWIGGPGSWTDPSHSSHTPPPAPEMDRSLLSGEDTVGIGPSAGTVTIPTGIPVGCKTLNLSANLRMENTSTLDIWAGDLNLDNSLGGGVVTMVGSFNTSIIFRPNRARHLEFSRPDTSG